MVNLVRGLFCITVFLLFSSSHAATGEPEDIENYYSKETMKNACSEAELTRIHAEVIAIAGTRAPKQAWRLLKEMLCGTTKASIKYVRANSYDGILYEDNTKTDDGSPAYSYIPSKNLETVQGGAWEPNVNNLKGDISVVYNMGGVCAGGFDIHFDNTQWKLSKAGIGCD